MRDEHRSQYENRQITSLRVRKVKRSTLWLIPFICWLVQSHIHMTMAFILPRLRLQNHFNQQLLLLHDDDDGFRSVLSSSVVTRQRKCKSCNTMMLFLRVMYEQHKNM
jgi:hypothetical protein